MAYKTITFVGVGAEAHDAGSGGNVTPGIVAGLVANDVMVVEVSAADNVVCSVPGGWTIKQATNQTATLRQTIVWRRFVAGDAAPLITHAAGNGITARMTAWRGVDPNVADPIEAIQTQGTSASATATAPDLTTLTPGAAVLFIGSEELTGNTSGSPVWGGYSGTDPTFVEVADNANGLNSNMISGAAAWGTRIAAGAIGSRTATISGEAATPTANIATVLALTPELIAPVYDRGLPRPRPRTSFRGWETVDEFNFLRYFSRAAVAGGTLFTVTLAGTLTSSGGIRLATTKQLAGTASSSGAIQKLSTRTTLAGTMTSSGVVVKTTKRLGLGGTLTSAGALVKTGIKQLAGTMTSSGALSVLKVKIVLLAGTLTSSGALQKLTTKAGLAGTMASSGSVTKTNTKVLGGTLTSSGVIRRATTRLLGGTMTSSGALATLKVKIVLLVGTLTSSGALVKTGVKQVGGTLTSSGLIRRATTRQVGGTLNPSGGIVKRTTIALGGLLTFVGTLTLPGFGAPGRVIMRDALAWLARVLDTGARAFMSDDVTQVVESIVTDTGAIVDVRDTAAGRADLSDKVEG